MLLFFFGGDMSCYMLLLSLLLKWVLYTHVEWVVHVSTRFGCSSAHPRKKRRLDLCYLVPALYSYHFHISQQDILKHLWGYSLSTWAVVSISRQHAGKHSSKKNFYTSCFMTSELLSDGNVWSSLVFGSGIWRPKTFTRGKLSDRQKWMRNEVNC